MIDHASIIKSVSSMRATAHAYRRDGDMAEFHRLMQAARFYLRFARKTAQPEEIEHDRTA